MTGDIRKHLEKTPFMPFSIRMADGQQYRVPTRDHILVAAGRAIVLLDNDDYEILPGLLMSGLSVATGATALETRPA